MTIPFLKPNQVPIPSTGQVYLFYNTDNGSVLTAKDSSGILTPLGELPSIDTTNIDDCLCEEVKKIVTDAGCSLTKGIITASEYQSIVNNINLFSTVLIDPSTGGYSHGITSIPTIFIALTLTNVLCNGESNGTAVASVTGGVGPYTIAFTDLAGGAVDPAALAAGSYKITVTDANGTVKVQTFVITEPPVLALNTTAISGVSPNAEATALPYGGTAPYTYVWKDNLGVPIGQTTQTATALSSGTYQVEVTDANGCTVEDTNVVIP